MIIEKLENMTGGWFIGNFFPTAYVTSEFEVGYKLHQKNEKWDIHYHEKIKEINLLIRGEMIIQNTKLKKGDIFILEPYEIADPEFLEDCEIVCVKIPGIKGDKVTLIKNEKYL
jgi:hypothetical protein